MTVSNTLTNLSEPSAFVKADAFLNTVFPKRKLKKVLLVNPPDADVSLFRYNTAKRLRYTNYPPYGLALLAQNLRNMEIDVRICNLNHEILMRCIKSEKELEFQFDEIIKNKLNEDILDFKPDLIGVTCMFTMTHESFRVVCRQIASNNIPLAIGGVHVSNDVDRILDDIPQAHFAFLREGDVVFKEFIKIVNQKLPIENLAQCVFNAPEKRLHFFKELQPDDEAINVMPSYDLIDISAYSSYGTIGAFYCFKPPKTRFATILSNRGCRAQCSFCSVRNFNGSGVRQRSVESVVDELEYLQNEHGIGHVMWLDDDLFKDAKRTINLYNEMVRRNLKLTWDATNGVIAAACTEEIIAAAAESGCIALNIGMESGNPEILREIVKPGTVKSFIKAAEILRKYEQIHSSVFLMIGFPNETFSMILDTINVSREMDLDWYRASVLQPLPNTPIYDSMVAQGLIQDVDSKIRFMGGAYGKQTEMEQGFSMSSPDFEKAFSTIAPDTIPSAEQLTDIWFYMNYHLNFNRIFYEKRPIKREQLIQHLQVLSDVISPENGFALYFLGFLQHQMEGVIDEILLDRLQDRLDTSDYWNDRFQAFNLSIDDLRNQVFDQSHLSRLAPELITA